MKKFYSIILTAVMMISAFGQIAAGATTATDPSIIFEDDGTLGTWATTVTDDAAHGTVYKFDTTSGQNSAKLSSQALPAGKYMMSVDFKVEESTANEARQGVIMALNNWPENIVVNPRFNAENNFYISYGYTNGFESGTANKADKYVGGSYSAYTVNAWHNMAFVIETTDSTEEGVAQNAKVNLYIDGAAYGSFEMKLKDAWKFQYLQMCAPKTANGATPMYIDNIVISDVSSSNPFEIESVTPVLKNGSMQEIQQLKVKLSQPVDKSTISKATVKTLGYNVQIAGAATVVGQYVYIPVSNLNVGTGYVVDLGAGIKSVVGEELSIQTFTVNGASDPKIFADDGSLGTWATTATDDAMHGTVYKFDTTSGQNSAQLSSQALPAGKYMMSVDFKVEASTANEARQGVIMAFNTWPENIVVNPKFNAENKFLISYGYTNGFESGTANKVDKYVQGNYSSYTVNQWHNMAFVIETTDSTEEGVAQNATVNLYIDGAAYGSFEMKLKEAWKFQYLQMCAPKTANGATPMYIDNIVISDVSESNQFAVENVNTVLKSGSTQFIEKLVVKMNQPVDKSTLSSISVKKAGFNTEVAGVATAAGQYIYIPVSNLKVGTGYVIDFGTEVKSVAGAALSLKTYTVNGDADYALFEDDGTLGTWATNVTDDAAHGTVYKFDTTSAQKSEQLSSQALPAGKYMMSVDFKVDASTANEARSGQIMTFNTWPENIVVNPRFNEENKFLISYGYTNGFEKDNANKVDKYVGGSYNAYTVNKWHNMAFVIETTDSTEEGVAQNAKVQLYIDEIPYGSAFEFKLIEDWKFQYLQMCAPKTANGATPMYIDNIKIEKIMETSITGFDVVDSGSDAYVTATITNADAEVLSVMVIIAEYTSSNTLNNVVAKKVEVPAGKTVNIDGTNNTVKLTTSIGNTVKAFVWDTNLNPLTEAVN